LDLIFCRYEGMYMKSEQDICDRIKRINDFNTIYELKWVLGDEE